MDTSYSDSLASPHKITPPSSKEQHSPLGSYARGYSRNPYGTQKPTENPSESDATYHNASPPHSPTTLLRLPKLSIPLPSKDQPISPPQVPDVGGLHRFLPSNGDELHDQNNIYSSDHFRMFEFKVRRCMRARSHDWTECPFTHPGEKARRRDPRRYHYGATPCPEFRKGSCRRGDSCEYSHGVFECWLHPARYRTQPCKDGKNCKRRVCFFAHSNTQLRLLPSAIMARAVNSFHDVSSPTSTLAGFPNSPTHLSPPLSPKMSSPCTPSHECPPHGFFPHYSMDHHSFVDLPYPMSPMSPASAFDAHSGHHAEGFSVPSPMLFSEDYGVGAVHKYASSGASPLGLNACSHLNSSLNSGRDLCSSLNPNFRFEGPHDAMPQLVSSMQSMDVRPSDPFPFHPQYHRPSELAIDIARQRAALHNDMLNEFHRNEMHLAMAGISQSARDSRSDFNCAPKHAYRVGHGDGVRRDLSSCLGSRTSCLGDEAHASLFSRRFDSPPVASDLPSDLDFSDFAIASEPLSELPDLGWISRLIQEDGLGMERATQELLVQARA